MGKELKRCVLVGNAGIGNYEKIKEYLKEDDFFVYCDGGLKHLEKLGFSPNLIVGDFDSYKNPEMDVETIVLPCVKDDTDTCFALKECVKRGFEDFLMIGCIGQRFDHTLGNVSLLIMLKQKGLNGMIIDDYSEMSMVKEGITSYIEDTFSYFSLMVLSDKAEGVTIKNAKYPLEDGIITSEYQYGISNEVIKGKRAEVSSQKGNIVLIKVF